MDSLTASPFGGTWHTPSGPVATHRLQEAINLAGPGCTIRLLAGYYDTPVELKGKHQITLCGENGAVLDARRNVLRPPDSINSSRAAKDGIDVSAMVRVDGCSGITLDNFIIQNAWPVAIALKDTHDIAIRRINFNGATVAILAWGRETHDLLIERCAWHQDDRIWQDIAWQDIHGDPKPCKELDGDFFRSFDIPGRCVLRYNYISNAFNGIQLFSIKRPKAETNENVWIYRNTFAFIRDNAVEAEYAARNWWVFENRIFNCHKWFAFEKCAGGFWYIFANRGWFDRKPGPPFDCNAGGAVFKTNSIAPDEEADALPSDPVYVFHNSWYLRSTYVKSGKLRQFSHFNNAIEYADPARHPPGVCDPERLMIGEAPPEMLCASPGDRADPFTQEWGRLNIRFFNDVCNHRDYPDKLAANWYPATGRHAAPGFAAPRDGDFSPVGGSPLLGSSIGHDLRLANGRLWKLPPGLNIGAMQAEATRYTPGALCVPENVLGPNYEEPQDKR